MDDMSPGRSRSELRAAGWDDDEIDVAVRRGDLVAVSRDALVPHALADDLRARCAAALGTQREDAAASHRTAAALLGLRWLPATWLLSDQPLDVTVARDDLTRSTRAGMRRRIAELPAEDVTAIRGLRVCHPARTVVDLARTEPTLLALQIADGALTDGRCSAEDLFAVCERMVRVPGVRRARRLAELARTGVDSPPETTVRWQIVNAGLPEPQTRLELFGADGRLLALGDLGYWRWLIWIEYDGWVVHGAQPTFRSDRFRDRWLARRGWEVMRLHDEDVRRPRAFLQQLEAAIGQGADRVLAMDPARSPELTAAQALLRADPASAVPLRARRRHRSA